MDGRRRRLPRQEADWPGKYTIEGPSGGVWGSCVVVDISILGAGLELFGVTPKDLIGNQILVEVQTPSGASISIQMIGEIRYSREGTRGGTRVGIEFGPLSKAERDILDALDHMHIVW